MSRTMAAFQLLSTYFQDLLKRLMARLLELKQELQERFRTEIDRVGVDKFLAPLIDTIHILHQRVSRWEVGVFIFVFAFLFFWLQNAHDLILDLSASAIVYFPLKSTHLLVFHAAGKEFFHENKRYRWSAFFMGFTGATFLAFLVIQIFLLLPFPPQIVTWFPAGFVAQSDIRKALWKAIALSVGLGSSYFLSITLEEIDIVDIVANMAKKKQNVPTSSA